MHAVVVYESLFGNTQEVAQVVAEGLRRADPGATVDCISVDAADHVSLGPADLLIVGAPTHFWGLTSTLSRAMEREYELRLMRTRAGTGAELRRRAVATHGVRGWLSTVPRGRASAAAFDTRMDRVLSGGAAPGIARRLRHRGYRLVVAPKPFIVQGISGPLRTGQAEQAARWAAELERAVRRE